MISFYLRFLLVLQMVGISCIMCYREKEKDALIRNLCCKTYRVLTHGYREFLGVVQQLAATV